MQTSFSNPESEMSDERRSSVCGSVREGLPWQIIYASFLGVTLCSSGVYGGFYLASGRYGTPGVAAGTGAILVALAIAAAFVALMMGLRWAFLVCRIVVPLFGVAFLSLLVWGLVGTVRSIDWSLSGTSFWRGALDVASDVRVCVPLCGAVLCGAVLLLLFGRAARRFFA